MTERTKILKIIIIGDGRVGKSTLRRRYFGENFDANYIMTLGADFAVKNETVNERNYVLQIWDLAGQPKFKEIREAYYNNTSGMILVFDVNLPETFDSLPGWITEFSSNQEFDVRDVPIILVGNKIDLRGEPGSELVTAMQGMEYAKTLSEWSHHEVPYVETSALVGLNVEVPFKYLILNLEKKPDR